MRAIVLAVLAAVAGFALFVFWAGGREAAPPVVSVPVTESAPAEPAARAVDMQAEKAGDAATGAVGAAAANTATASVGDAVGSAADTAVEASRSAAQSAADGADALRNEIQGLVDEVVKEPAPSN